MPKILQAMRDNGSPAPLFETDEARVSFLVRLPVRAGVGPQAAPQVTPQVTPQVEMALLLFCIEPRSAQEILSELGLKDRKYFRAAYLKPMLGAGFLECTIPEKPQSRLQRYRTTGVGKSRLSPPKGSISSGSAAGQTPVIPPKSPPKSKVPRRGSKRQ